MPSLASASSSDRPFAAHLVEAVEHVEVRGLLGWGELPELLDGARHRVVIDCEKTVQADEETPFLDCDLPPK
jgi:hypothetical protein